MNFTVLWLPEALGQLAEAWNAAANRNAVTEASFRIDLRLAADPLNDGESRDEDERILIDLPLQVLYRVFPTAREVHVISSGPFGRRP